MSALGSLIVPVAITRPHLFGLIGLIVLWLGPTLLVVWLAKRKGRNWVVYLVVSLVIGWPLPLIAALVIRPRQSG